MSEKKGIEYISIRLAAGEWGEICAALKADGYPESSDGVRDFLFDVIREDDETAAAEPEVNPAFNALFDYLKKNPDAIKGVAGLTKSALAALLKNKMGL